MVLPELVKQNIGVLAMKTLANGTILESKTVTAIECLQYAMNLPTSVVITGCESMENLEQALTAARTFKPMSSEQVKSLLSKTEKAASRGEYELFKTTSIYDGTASHPEWLGEEPPEVQRVMQTTSIMIHYLAALGKGAREYCLIKTRAATEGRPYSTFEWLKFLKRFGFKSREICDSWRMRRRIKSGSSNICSSPRTMAYLGSSATRTGSFVSSRR